MIAKFKRIDGIAIASMFFYLLIVLMTGFFLDGNSSIVAEGNPIQALGQAFAFPSIDASMPSAILLIMLAVYSLLFAGAVIFEIRVAQYKNEKANSLKWWMIYIITFVISYGLAIGIGTAAHSPIEDPVLLGNSFLYCAESFLIGFLIFLVLFLIVFFLVLLVISVKKIRTPLEGEEEVSLSHEEHQELINEAKAKLQGSLAASFGGNANISGSAAGAAPSNANQTSSYTALGNKSQVFPGLTEIETQELNASPKEYSADGTISLHELASRFRMYLAKEEKLYYDIESIRSFLAGMAASHFLILEGLSGTGKSSLARYFSSFIGEKSFFAPVQATWRDRTSLLGFYNDFSRSYSETPFLKRLYQANFRERSINVMVLDEMNIARVEYYFADFLSIMEYPEEDWILDIMQLPYGFEPPMHFQDGRLTIPVTTWFIGTANKDDSTYTITDKVYDRAIVLSFDEQNEPFRVEGEASPIALSYQGLTSLFEEAEAKEEYRMNAEDEEKLNHLAEFCYDKFELAFGNRIRNQMEIFVPVYVSAGGKKEEAIDFMFARKVLSKLEGRFEEYVGEGLRGLLKLLDSLYGRNAFPSCRALIAHYLRRFA